MNETARRSQRWLALLAVVGLSLLIGALLTFARPTRTYGPQPY